jgi:uncharacterized membrane protein YeaQ/YmgE (transglycosylase-associated protein family)
MSPAVTNIVITLLIGIVAGWLASLFMGGGGLLRYLITGLIGSFVGGWLLGALGIHLPIGNPLLSQIITGAIGAVVVIFIARQLA